jgi:alkaline phosphatase D
MLGEDQWAWLEGELRKPANLRLIASGTRVLAEKIGQEE